MSTREELLALRSEFKELANQIDQPWAIRNQKGNWPHTWLLKGFPVFLRTFGGLAARAVAVLGRSGVDSWLDQLHARNPLVEEIHGYSGETSIHNGKLYSVAQLSVEEIDRLLAELPAESPLPPPPKADQQAKRTRRDIDWWLEKLTDYESAWADDSSLTETAFANSIGEKPNTVSKMFRNARKEKDRRTEEQKKMRENRQPD